MSDTTSKSSKLLYRQVGQRIISGIQNGCWPVGNKLPPEKVLAKEYGVSLITVRRALRDLSESGRVKTRHGGGTYVRSLNPVRYVEAKKLLGLVIVNSAGYYNGWLVEGIETAAGQLDYSVIIKHSFNIPKEETACIEGLVEMGVAGLIIVPASHDEAETLVSCASLLQKRIPFVLADRYLPELKASCVITDNEAGGFEITQHLLDNGYSKIGYISDFPCSSSRAREKGYRKAMDSAGISVPEGWVCHTGVDEDGLVSVRRFIEEHRELTAIFAMHDGLARSIYEVCRQEGIHIPQDLAVAGYDDAPYAALLHPSLTSMSQPAVEMGKKATELLVQVIKRNVEENQRIVLPHEFVIRESTDGLKRNRVIAQAADTKEAGSRAASMEVS